MHRALSAFACLVVALAGPARAGGPGTPLPVIDATNDRIVYFDEFDGAPSPGTIDLAPLGIVEPVHATPFSLGPIWVTDRATDSVYRLDYNGGLLGVTSSGLDDVRGITYVHPNVYVANRGSANGAPGPSIVILDANGNILGSFPVADPDGVIVRGSELLVGNVAAHDLDRYTTSGTFLGKFHDSDGITGIDAPGQIGYADCRGRLLCAGDGANPGIYEYDASGAQVGYFATASGVRGVRALRNGNWIWTDASGVHVRDFRTSTTIDVLPGIDARFVGETIVELPSMHAFCLGSLTACPCGNNPPPGCTEGCGNSFGAGASFEGGGISSVGADTVRFHVRGMPNSAPALFFQGTIQQSGGAGSVFGDGVRCAGGSVIRLATKTASNGFATYPEPGDLSVSVKGQVPATGFSERTYQCWYRNAASFCTAATFNLTNGWFVTWYP